MALTTLAAVKARFSPSLDSTQDAAITQAIAEGDAYIKRYTGRNIEEAAFTEYFDGKGQTRLALYPGRQPVQHAAGKYVTVTDSGVALTVDNALGYNTTADVFLENIDLDRQCILHYETGFTWGRQNITVTYTAGWSTIPADIISLANEVAWLIFNSHIFVAKSQASGSRGSVSWEKDLTPVSMATLKRLRVV